MHSALPAPDTHRDARSSKAIHQLLQCGPGILFRGVGVLWP